MACESQSLETVYGSYDTGYMRVGENSTTNCTFDNNSNIKAVFFCERNESSGIAELRSVYHCIKTKNTINYENLANVSNYFAINSDYIFLSDYTYFGNSKSWLAHLKLKCKVMRLEDFDKINFHYTGKHTKLEQVGGIQLAK